MSTAAEQQVQQQAAAQAKVPTTHYRITLRRSAIGLPEKTTKILKALGLRKRLQSVYRPQRGDMAGAILAVKELVHVENVRRLDGGLEEAAKAQAEAHLLRDEDAVWVNGLGEVVDWGGKRARKAPRGYKVVANVANEVRHAEIVGAANDSLNGSVNQQ
ncbi:hypothetical protein FA10DRAFT_225521 [Acaromyces ingoldii]|uniref:Large ribosomal subunit protein uL30m n=1 Tax=Acaromyces ingoldii TaxID=215250 RepID=A0A316YXQ6_9BASI|nr:hypothetical protein FA10DRAFT_225521 [Acaromyces ingoldii]PWN94227.1 hypothetical protein FA10DRAFT_225521 [Acaromyces ingoldii]